MQRYFIEEIDNGRPIFSKEQTHHIVNVMRMKSGDRITIVYQNESFLCELENNNPLSMKIIERLNEDHELHNDVTLLYCLPKGEKLELVVQKATELGVNEIILVQSERCIAKITKENKDKKLLRLNKIALEASEQSKRTKVPLIKEVISYKELSKFHFDHQFIAYENEGDLSFKTHIEAIKENESIGILIGSEGGFSPSEVEKAKEAGYISVSLGKRILRSETAVFYALSTIGFVLENK